MMQRFKIIVPSFNSTDYLPKTLHSIETQTDNSFDVLIIDDCSTLDAQREIIKDFCERNHWDYIFNDKNQGALYNLVHGIQRLNCADDDVIVIVDGDDWLAHADVLTHLRNIYSESDIGLTWGQCEIYPPKMTPVKYAQNIPEMVIKQKLYRDYPLAFWHLRTFKYGLWMHVRDEDLRDEDGEYFHIMYDKAMLFPMLEMAGDKIRFISETLYIYNVENPLSDFLTTRSEEFRRVDDLIRSRKRYPTLSIFQ